MTHLLTHSGTIQVYHTTNFKISYAAILGLLQSQKMQSSKSLQAQHEHPHGRPSEMEVNTTHSKHATNTKTVLQT